MYGAMIDTDLAGDSALSQIALAAKTRGDLRAKQLHISVLRNGKLVVTATVVNVAGEITRVLSAASGAIICGLQESTRS